MLQAFTDFSFTLIIIGNIQDGSTASLSIQSAEDTYFTANLQCNLTIQPMCTVLDDAGIGMSKFKMTLPFEKILNLIFLLVFEFNISRVCTT